MFAGLHRLTWRDLLGFDPHRHSEHDSRSLAPRAAMDVTCDRCSTEYEFDEALVSPRGTTVKCTACGHLFKVSRAEPTSRPQLLGTHWTVRCTDGSSHQLESLADLTRYISEAKFARDDQVSRTGKA
jgi:predicted Zn finger-like uncharacterized protein